jgi:hypothetical protein
MVEMIEHENVLENLDVEYEIDSAYGGLEQDTALDEIVSREKIILCGDISEGVLPDAHYIYVDPEYRGTLSPGQRQLYELLLLMQESSVYTLTSIGKLAESMKCGWSLSVGKRLENLNWGFFFVNILIVNQTLRLFWAPLKQCF